MLLVPTLIAYVGLAFICGGIGCSVYAQYLYYSRPGAKLGFGFARYYYGEMRVEHPRVFAGSLGGTFLGIVIFLVAGLFIPS